ncbi:Hypothetical protein CAP_2257 [Chondromyces apiculatus DSM 436]|uniref:Uncharacterized protein n=1 Tax=Chondromyces apiculatus DSM 436 TaxID=1192034 RepID=A0A017TB09_9BACT|nr:Hypothetical protein CAP_2257 [Chondromyces apiculatus DSM 436]
MVAHGSSRKGGHPNTGSPSSEPPQQCLDGLRPPPGRPAPLRAPPPPDPALRAPHRCRVDGPLHPDRSHPQPLPDDPPRVQPARSDALPYPPDRSHGGAACGMCVRTGVRQS